MVEPRPRYQDALEALAEIARRDGSPALLRDVDRLLTDEKRRELTVLVGGQFKRGKSSLINALLKAELLPTGVIPLTSVTTRIRYGPTLCMTVTFLDGRILEIAPDELANYATERGNPKNERGVSRVEIEAPMGLLRGIAITDTPGIASTHEHNTEEARDALRHADVAVLVVGPEPPITSSEAAFAAQMREASERLFVVLNKADLLGEGLEEVVEFTQGVLAGVLGQRPRIFALSARRAMAASRAGISDAPFEAFLGALRGSLATERDRILIASLRRRAMALGTLLRAKLAAERRTLELPLEARAEELLRFRALDERLRSDCEDEVALFRRGNRDDIATVEDFLKSLRGDEGHTLDSAIALGDTTRFGELFRPHVVAVAEQWFCVVQSLLDQLIRKRAQRYARRVEALRRELVSLGLGSSALGDLELGESLDVRELSLQTVTLEQPTTGLDVLSRAALPHLPKKARVRYLRLSHGEALDRLRGQLRHAASDALERATREIEKQVSAGFDDAETLVRSALESAAGRNESSVKTRIEELASTEATVGRLMVTLADG